MNARVLQIVSDLERSDTTLQAVGLTRYLAPRGFACRVLSLGGDGPLRAELEAAGVPVTWVEAGSHRMPRTAGQAWQWARDFAPQVLHTWGDRPNRWGRLAALFLPSSRWIVSLRSLRENITWGTGLLERGLARRTAVYVANSDTLLLAGRKRGLPINKLVRINDGVPMVNRPGEAERARRLCRAGLPASAKLLVTQAPFEARGGIKDLIWATDLLKNIRDDVYCGVLGTGAGGWQLERFVRQVRIQDRIRFLGQPADANDWIAAADGFWYAAAGDMSPRGALVAMACGTPVILSDEPAHRELIRHDDNGCCVRRGDRAGYARQAQRVLNEAASAARMAAKARQDFERYYRQTDCCAQYNQLYAQLLDGSSPLVQRSNARIPLEPTAHQVR